jgi:hypothetical protein
MFIRDHPNSLHHFSFPDFIIGRSGDYIDINFTRFFHFVHEKISPPRALQNNLFLSG